MHLNRQSRLRISVIAITLALVIAKPQVVSAQDAVPVEMLERTLFVKIGNVEGTAFTLDYQGELYLVTARHVVNGLPVKGAKLQVWKSGHWEEYKTQRTLYPPDERADVAVFDTGQAVAKPFEVLPVGQNGGTPTFGQRVWFLGYPWGIATKLKNATIPFIKGGTFSAVDATDLGATVFYIDGFNNPGFSGGPIIFWDFHTHAYRILGVVMGYREEAAKAEIGGAQVDSNILVNSGILVGYSIESAIQAIETGGARR